MFPATQQLLERLARRYSEAREWFDTLRRWYKDARLTKNVIEELLSAEDLHLLRLQLNGQADPSGVVREVDGRRILLRIPAALLQLGENKLSVGLSDDAERPLELESVYLGQHRTQIRQKIDFTTRNPESAPAFHLVSCDRAESRAGCWELLANGSLTFQLYLHTEGKVIVALEMPRATRFPLARTRSRRQQKLLKEVGKRVEKKLKKWIDERAERNQGHDEGVLEDLLAYRDLHARQLRLALEHDGSLQSAIDRTGNPDAIVSAQARPVLLAPEVISLVAAPVVRQIQSLAEVVRPVAARVNPPQAVPAKAVAAKAAGSSFAGKLMLTLLVAGVSSGAYAAWKYDGVNWLRQRWAALTAPAGTRGDVLTALRESGKDLNWSMEVCQEIPKDKLKGLQADFGELLGAQDNQLLEKVKVFMAGDRKNPLGEAFVGFPVCDNMLVVHDFGEATAAKQHLEKMPQQFQAGLQKWGFQGSVSEIAIPHGDGAVRLTTQVGDIRQHQTVARCGRFILQTVGDGATSGEEQERRLTTLAKRLREHFGS